MPNMARKRANRYHHGDLSRALLQEALRTIEKGGVSALTMRGRRDEARRVAHGALPPFRRQIGTACGRCHRGIPDACACTRRTRGRPTAAASEGLEAMGEAYVRFAVAHPSHYRVMFGGYVRDACTGFGPGEGGRGGISGARRCASISQQEQGLVRHDNPLALAQYIWANVHGIAMLAIDGQLKQPTEDVIRFANERMRTGIESTVKRVEESTSREESRSPESEEAVDCMASDQSLETRTGLDPWVHAELPDAPAPTGFEWLKVVGPGVIVLGLSLGGGEFLLGPTAFVRYGLSLLWITLVAVFFQTIFNTELMRYTLATGEPVFTGFMRTKPSRAFWAWLYVATVFAAGRMAVLGRAVGRRDFLSRHAPHCRAGRCDDDVSARRRHISRLHRCC